jgi:hypothetical protein
MNIEAEASNEEESKILKETMQKSFKTLEYCINQDARINYHTFVYAKNTIRYYEKFDRDKYLDSYVESSLDQLKDILSRDEYIPAKMRRELIECQNKLQAIRS